MGLRFGGDLPKQFLPLGGKPVIRHSLAAFDANNFVDKIIIVAPAQFWDACRDMGISKLSQVVEGGKTRKQSVAAGLTHADGGLVLIHDAARPFVPLAQTEALLEAAHSHGGATLATPATDTLKIADNYMGVDKTLERDRVFAVQTPQAFQADVLKKAHALDINDAYDDCQLLEYIGIKPRLIMGDPINIKITHPMDLEIAEIILAKRSKTDE